MFEDRKSRERYKPLDTVLTSVMAREPQSLLNSLVTVVSFRQLISLWIINCGQRQIEKGFDSFEFYKWMSFLGLIVVIPLNR